MTRILIEMFGRPNIIAYICKSGFGKTIYPIKEMDGKSRVRG